MEQNKINIEIWLQEFKNKLLHSFGNRITFLGLQGSYGRGEATSSSDIDIVVILDQINFNDLIEYRKLITSMEYSDLICGFIADKTQLEAWEKFDLLQLYLDTVPIIGDLNYLKKYFLSTDLKRAIHIFACNIYHSCSLNFLHERSTYALKELYKSTRFLIRLKFYFDKEKYLSKLHELKLNVDDAEKLILDVSYSNFLNITNDDFIRMSNILFDYSSKLIVKYKI